MSACILAHDLGTSGDKASLFGEDGKLIESVTEEYPTYYPQAGWAEQNPDDWWRAVCAATRRILERADKKKIVAVAVTGQMMGTVPIAHDGELLGNSIIWSDARAVKECKELEARLGRKNYCRITGQPPSAAYTLPKIMWLKKNRLELYQRSVKFIQSKDFITYKLTGNIATDYTDAAYTTAFDIQKGNWSEEIISAAEIQMSKMPVVLKSDAILGTVSHEASRECGLMEGTPVAAGAGDGSAAHLGAACTEKGDAYLCLGSSTWLAAQTDRLIFDEQERMQSEPHVIPDQFCFLGTMQTGGLAYSWGRQNMSDELLEYEKLEALIQDSPVGAGGVLFLPYLMGERSPWYDLDARGAFLGLRMQTKYGDFYRAIMEGVAMNLNILLKVIKQKVDISPIVVIGGGGKSHVWQQILADVFEQELSIPENVESGTSIGGAIIAGVGCGVFQDYSVAKKFLKIEYVVKPRPECSEIYRNQQIKFEESYKCLRSLYT